MVVSIILGLIILLSLIWCCVRKRQLLKTKEREKLTDDNKAKSEFDNVVVNGPSPQQHNFKLKLDTQIGHTNEDLV